MNKNKLAGLILVIAAGVLVCACARATHDGLAVRCFGKAIWFLPYAALVVGIDRFARA